MRFAILSADPKTLAEGAVIGIVDGEFVYEGAVNACKKIKTLRSEGLPFRETGWPTEGGLFYTSKLKGETRVKAVPFYIRVSGS